MGAWEIILIVLVIVLIFGAKKLPDLARALGRSVGEFKKGQTDGAKLIEEDKQVKAESTSATPAKPE